MTLSFRESVAALAGITVIMLLGLFLVEAPTAVIFMGELVFVTIIGLLKKHPYKKLQQAMIAGVTEVLTPILTLLLIGALVTSWIMGGTMPTLIHFGLKIIDAKAFLLIAFLMCSLTSMVVGTSWGTISTLGIAFLGISNALGIDLLYTAAALASGAIFGDKLSPLSSSVALASELSDAAPVDCIKSTAKTTVVGFMVSIPLYWYIGSTYNLSGEDAFQQSQELISAIESEFTLGLTPVLPPIIIFVLIMLRIPNIPTFAIGILLGVLEAVFIQGYPLNEVCEAMFSGFVMNHNPVIGQVLNYSGMNGMASITILIVFASAFGGVVKTLGIINALLSKIFSGSSSKAKVALVGTLIHTVCFFITGSYYAVNSILAPPLNEAYDKHHLPRANVASLLLNGGTGISPIIPWSGTGIFMAGVFGLSSTWYCIFAPVLWLPLLLEPIATIIKRK
ncbi:MAG: hypothetical protein IKW01_02910 [Firmicutes bacterium]|nr:hypothetical protein [Bacillota bacterium]